MGAPHRFGRYETLRVIASGGMATVYLSRALGEGGFERLVAIKVMHPHIAADPDFQAMFLDEARLAARIRHPNVVGVLDVEKTPARGGPNPEPEGMFIVMEYVDGPSLHQLRRGFRKHATTLPLGICLRIFVDVLTGLHAAHELEDAHGQRLHLVHRDVSPQNILVGKDGVSRITDFGVARANARITSTRGGALKGKIAYMSPEQITEDNIDQRADVYAAGCSLWEALTGVRLFRADSEAALIHLILQGNIQHPRELNAELPPAIDRVVMRALSTDRNGRQPDAALFADELEIAARESNVDIATHRQVAAFVKELPEHQREPRPALPSSPSARTSLSGIDDIPCYGDDGAPLPRDPYLTPPRQAFPRSGTTTRGLERSGPAAPPQNRAAMWIMVAAAGIVCGGGGAYLTMNGAGETSGPAAAPADTVAGQPPPPASDPVAVAPPAPAVETEDESEEVVAPKRQVASAGAPSAEEERPTPAEDRGSTAKLPGRYTKPAPAKTAKPPAPTTPGKPGYIPPEL